MVIICYFPASCCKFNNFYCMLIILMFCATAHFRTSNSVTDENEPGNLSEDDWQRLNNIIGYKEGDSDQLLEIHGRADLLHTSLEIHMKHNASRLADEKECLADLSCENLDCFVNLYSEAKVFDVRLGSYQLSSPNGLLAEVRSLVVKSFSIFLPFPSMLLPFLFS